MMTKSADQGKTIFIILDGLDYEYITEHSDKLKFFHSLREQALLAPLESVVPPDSIPSWTTIYTGLNPAEHGVLESIDYLSFKNKVAGDYSIIKEHTFWDVLSRKGKRVFVFNPFMAYPAWDVNGLMICGPVFEGGEISTNLPEEVDTSVLPTLGGMVEHPSDMEMEQFYEETMTLTQQQFDAFGAYFNAKEYDFAFLGITTADRMQHFLWRYTDPEDRTYPRGGRLKDSILNMYRLMENNIKKIFEAYGDQYNVVIVSDHGHGRRCQKTFYVNQWLIRQGIVADQSLKKRAVEYAKNTAFWLLAAMHRVETGVNFFKRFRFAHRVKSADYVFSDEKQKVHVPKFDGTNPYGGINVLRAGFASDIEYEAMRQRIIDGLMKVRDRGMNVMLWARRREDIYHGDMVSNYPSIVFRMLPDYGVDRGLFGKRIFGINAMHEILSGGHQSVGVILGNRADLSGVKSVLDIHQYVVGLVDRGINDE